MSAVLIGLAALLIAAAAGLKFATGNPGEGGIDAALAVVWLTFALINASRPRR